MIKSILIHYLAILIFVQSCAIAYIKNNEILPKSETSFSGNKIPVFVHINSKAEFNGRGHEPNHVKIRDNIYKIFSNNPFLSQRFEVARVDFYVGSPSKKDNQTNALEIHFSDMPQENNFTTFFSIFSLMVIPGYVSHSPIYDITYFDAKGTAEKIVIPETTKVSQITIYHWFMLPFFWLSNGDVFSPSLNNILTSQELTGKLNHNFIKKQDSLTIDLFTDTKSSCFEKNCLVYDLPKPWFVSYAEMPGSDSKLISFNRKDIGKSKSGFKSFNLGLIFVMSKEKLDPLRFSIYAKQYSELREYGESIYFRNINGKKDVYKFFGSKGKYISEGKTHREYLLSATEDKLGIVIKVTFEEEHFAKVDNDIQKFLKSLDIKPNLLYKEISENERAKKIQDLQTEGLQKINLKTSNMITEGLNKYLAACELGSKELCTQYSILKSLQVQEE